MNTDCSVITPPQLARRWGTSEESILGMIRRGELPAIRIGAGQKRPRWRIATSVIERIEQTGTATTPAPGDGFKTYVAGHIEAGDDRKAGLTVPGHNIAVGSESTSKQQRRPRRPSVPRYV